MTDSRGISWFTALCLAALAAVRGHAQILAAAPASLTASPGQTATVSLSLASHGVAIAGIQFDLQWDASLFVQPVAGDQVRPGSKSLFMHSIAAEGIRCLIVGVNQTSLEDGELVKLIVSSDPTAPQGAAQIRIANVVAAGPDATAVTLSAAPVSVQLQGATSGLPFPANAVLNAASWAPGPISAGEVISLVGGLGPSTTVLINGVSAPILYAGANQVNAIVPFILNLSQTAAIQILSPGRTFSPVAVPMTAVSPAIFTLSGAGFGPGAILNQDYSVNSSQNPAPPGSVVMIYGTGFGLLTPAGSDGQLAAGPANTVLPVTANVGGVPASVLYAGAAPGIVYGVIQVNVAIPQAARSDPAAAVTLTVNGVTTPAGVSVAIQPQ